MEAGGEPAVVVRGARGRGTTYLVTCFFRPGFPGGAYSHSSSPAATHREQGRPKDASPPHLTLRVLHRLHDIAEGAEVSCT